MNWAARYQGRRESRWADTCLTRIQTYPERGLEWETAGLEFRPTLVGIDALPLTSLRRLWSLPESQFLIL